MDQAALRYALIGGFAMAMRGVQRATVDLDFLLLAKDLESVDQILHTCGYERVFRSENVSHYRDPTAPFGRIDILHAFRAPSLGMLDRAERLEISPGLSVPVLHIEDLIGLKIQAAVNDPAREAQDWQDIHLLLQAAAYDDKVIDWALIADYLALFQLSHRLQELKDRHGPID